MPAVCPLIISWKTCLNILKVSLPGPVWLWGLAVFTPYTYPKCSSVGYRNFSRCVNASPTFSACWWCFRLSGRILLDRFSLAGPPNPEGAGFPIWNSKLFRLFVALSAAECSWTLSSCLLWTVGSQALTERMPGYNVYLPWRWEGYTQWYTWAQY